VSLISSFANYTNYVAVLCNFFLLCGAIYR
jgi:hypothetical protein